MDELSKLVARKFQFVNDTSCFCIAVLSQLLCVPSDRSDVAQIGSSYQAIDRIICMLELHKVDHLVR